MKAKHEFFQNIKDLPKEERLTPGSPLCAGCGGLGSLRLMLNALEKPAVVVNAAGCLTLLAVYPYTPLKLSWLYTTMGSAAAGGQGIRDALDVLMAKGRLPVTEDLEVVVVGGDGSTYDMGLSSLSGAIHRDLDFYYLCYDNEAYGNTGFQMSSGSPLGSQTATSHSHPNRLAGTLQRKKDIFSIWQAHRPPYVASISTAEPVDLADKVRRASQHRGPKLFTAYATCPTGWGFDPSQGHYVAKMALETGVWPLKEAVNGKTRHTYVPARRKPVEEYLKTQGRFQHLFRPERQEEVLQRIQSDVEGYWEEVAQAEFVPSR
ncbi:MAG: thiamine pyrophosphate-dependent enzyme [Gemmataceae bacterium]